MKESNGVKKENQQNQQVDQRLVNAGGYSFLKIEYPRSVVVAPNGRISKQIHFYVDMSGAPFTCAYSNERICRDWMETEEALENGTQIIHTNQMGFLTTRLLEDGYRLFIHDWGFIPYSMSNDYVMKEIFLGENIWTSFAVYSGVNLFEYWQNGYYDYFACWYERHKNLYEDVQITSETNIPYNITEIF